MKLFITVGPVGNLQNNTQLGTIWQNSLATPKSPVVVVPSTQVNPNTTQIEAINVQQNTLREQIRQSEQNLQAQHAVSFVCHFQIVSQTKAQTLM